MPLTSMTGFADLPGGVEGSAWTWEARSVNGRGLDLRLRMPEGFESLDPPIRAAAARVLTRGSVTVMLRLAKGAGGAVPRLNPAALEAAIVAAQAASEAAARGGLDLAPMTAADLLAVRGVLEAESASAEDPVVLAKLTAEIEALFAALARARAAEGAAIAAVLAAQVDRVEALTQTARETAEARAGRNGVLLRSRVEAVLAATAAADEARLAQELAMAAVRADVTEELDRLAVHVAAARKLIAGDGPAGRKLDFLMQEFNREANTLCAKAGSSDLTAIGLEMKVAIDQMREQAQNVE
jgi:uncharacterized protein (TIGR00255 family)